MRFHKPKDLLLPEYKKYLADKPCVLSGIFGIELHHTHYRSSGHTLDNTLIPISNKVHYDIHHSVRSCDYNKQALLVLSVGLFCFWVQKYNKKEYYELSARLLENPLDVEKITLDWLLEDWLSQEDK